MAISVGFYRHVNKWLVDSHAKELLFRPFETNVNPYKADVFIVGAHPTPVLNLSFDQRKVYANSLVNRDEFMTLFPDYLRTTSRDVKGAIRFADALEKLGVSTVISYVNALTAKNLTELKKQKKENRQAFEQGMDIFKQVLEEIQPPIILLHGNYALEQFRENLLDYFVEFGHNSRKLEDLVGEGEFGKILYNNGKESIVIASKSLSSFKENDGNFAEVVKHLQKTKMSLNC